MHFRLVFSPTCSSLHPPFSFLLATFFALRRSLLFSLFDVAVCCLHLPLQFQHTHTCHLLTDERRLPLDERHTASSAGTVHFNSIAKEDAGLYKCVIVSLNGDRSEASILLKVAGKNSTILGLLNGPIFTFKCASQPLMPLGAENVTSVTFTQSLSANFLSFLSLILFPSLSLFPSVLVTIPSSLICPMSLIMSVVSLNYSYNGMVSVFLPLDDKICTRLLQLELFCSVLFPSLLVATARPMVKLATLVVVIVTNATDSTNNHLNDVLTTHTHSHTHTHTHEHIELYNCTNCPGTGSGSCNESFCFPRSLGRRYESIDHLFSCFWRLTHHN